MHFQHLQHLSRHPPPKVLPLLCPRCRPTVLCEATPVSRRFLHRQSDTHADWPASTNPTPYDVLNVPRDGPYNKARFYQLAKLYHPDRHHHTATTHPTLSPAARIERYRLVVLANDILSDPSKRSAYDSHGLGWTLARPVLTREAYRKWRTDTGSAARNATWEDWEDWHAAQRGEKQRPVYMSHGTFLALLAMAAGAAIFGQMNRAEAMANSRVKLMDLRQNEMIMGLDRRASATAGMGKAERVEWFIRDRENAEFGYAPQAWEAERQAREASGRH